MLVKTLCEVPIELFNNSLIEVNNIDWSSVVDPSRKASDVFSTSTAIHMRVHKVTDDTPKTLRGYCSVVECVDSLPNSLLYPEAYKLANWIYKHVNGLRLGRIMLVRLEAGGSVGLHIDPFEYFKVYSRYHVPIITNSNVVFSGGDDSEKEHMPVGMLSRLNNRKPHMLVNGGSDFRVHLIVDVETEGGNIIF